MGDTEIGPRHTAEEWYAAYEGYSRTLRTWLVAYGIGGPVVLLTNSSIWPRIAASGRSHQLGLLFLIGVALQVVLASINKATMWALYFGEVDKTFQKRRRYRFCEWVSEQFAIDFVIDITSMGLFAAATYLAFQVLTSAS